LKTQHFHEAEVILKQHRPRIKGEQADRDRFDRDKRNKSPGFGQDNGPDGEVSDSIANRLQVRYADGELERLGIVNLEGAEQSKLYVTHINRNLDFEDVRKVFAIFGEIEELYMFKDGTEQFRGSCFLKYTTRKESLRAILNLNLKRAN